MHRFWSKKLKTFLRMGIAPRQTPSHWRGEISAQTPTLSTPHSKTPGFATENNSNSITIVPLLNDMKLVQWLNVWYSDWKGCTSAWAPDWCTGQAVIIFMMVACSSIFWWAIIQLITAYSLRLLSWWSARLRFRFCFYRVTLCRYYVACATILSISSCLLKNVAVTRRNVFGFPGSE